MTGHIHLPDPRRWEALSRREALSMSAAMFVAVYVVQAIDTHAADAPEVLYTVPIALLAVRFGKRGGLLAAAFAVTLIAVYDLSVQVLDVSVVGNLVWTVAFVLLGGALGAYADRGRTLESRLLRYFEQSPDLLAVLGKDGRFARVNPAWESTLGFSAAALCSRPFIEFVHPEDRERTLAEQRISMAGRRDTKGFRNRYVTADGSYRWLEWSGHAGEPQGEVYVVARDVTIQHHQEQRRAGYARALEEAVAERTSELEDARAKTLHRLVLAAEYRDEDTVQHTERVADTSAEIATRLGMDATQVAILHEAAPLHDVGKIAIPDAILFKAGPLAPAEYEVMKTHAQLGADLLAGSGSPVLRMGTTIARSHHERWDGDGYPDGIAGERIPLVARIVAVADVFDALTHERPYKRAWPVERALAEIASGAGRQFDPRVVQAFLASRGRTQEEFARSTETAASASAQRLAGTLR